MRDRAVWVVLDHERKQSSRRAAIVSIAAKFPIAGTAALRFMRDGWIETIFIPVGISPGVAVTVFETSVLTGVQTDFFVGY